MATYLYIPIQCVSQLLANSAATLPRAATLRQPAGGGTERGARARPTHNFPDARFRTLICTPDCTYVLYKPLVWPRHLPWPSLVLLTRSKWR